jgi:hypothetical protein
MQSEWVAHGGLKGVRVPDTTRSQVAGSPNGPELPLRTIFHWMWIGTTPLESGAAPITFCE